jgi:ion channel POLLUX/CASTOR
MVNPTWKDRLRYRFDTFMAKGGASIFISLVVLFASALLLITLLRALFHVIFPQGAGEIDTFFRHLWTAFLELTDAGNMGEDSGSSGWFKLLAILAGFSGVVIFSVLIAFLTTALDQKLGDLRKGHSAVLEEGHTLILGWNERVVEILRELVAANESEDHPCAVVLSEVDKEEMDDYLGLHLPERKNTRVVTRSGNASALVSLDGVAVGGSKSVIVLAHCNESADNEAKAASDARVVKTVLAVLASRPEGKRFNIVAEVFDARGRAVVESLSPTEVTTIDTRDILAKILVQTARSSGLAVVYTEILGFAGNEMYFWRADWNGIPFGRVQYHFPDGIPLGIRGPDGLVVLNPPSGTPLTPQHEIVMLASDNSAIRFLPQPVAMPRELPLPGVRLERRPERVLILGWNAKAATIIRQYNDYAQEGSTAVVMVREASDELKRELAALQPQVPKLRLGATESDPLSPENLEAMRPFEYDDIIILSQGDGAGDPEKVDSETIIILLLLRGVFGRHPEAAGRTRLITEVMDSENQELVHKAGVNDFIISNRLVSKIFAQVSEQRDIKTVYDDLFRAEGSELYLKPIHAYLASFPVEVSFADLMLLAQKRNEVCLGVKIGGLEGAPDRNYGVILNPEKNTRWTLTERDALVVLAEDDS